MCGAGRRIVSPDMMTLTSWHTPCTLPGTLSWEFSLHGELLRTVLCVEHDFQVRTGAAPWVGEALPLENAPGGR